MHAVTFHAVDTQMKSMHKQGVGERSEPHSLYYKHVCVCVCVLREVTGSASTSSKMLLLSLGDGDCRPQRGRPVRYQP